jgi:hypothetical protein
VTGTDAGHAAREDLAAFLDELREDVGALVVDEVHLLDAELANFLFAEILTLAAARSTRAASAGTAFATRTTVSSAGTSVTAAVSTVTTAAIPSRRGTWRLCFLFVCHTFHPFT